MTGSKKRSKSRGRAALVQVKTLNNSYRKGEYYYSKVGNKTVYIKKDTISKKNFRSYIEKRYIKQENVELYARKGKKKELIYARKYNPSKENPNGVTRIYGKIQKDKKGKVKEVKTKNKYVLVADADYRYSGMTKGKGTISVSSSSIGSFNNKMNELRRNAYGAVASREGVGTGEVEILRIYNIHYSFIVETPKAASVKRAIFG